MPPASADTWFLERVQSEQVRLRSYIRALGVRAEAVDDLAQDTWARARHSGSTPAPAASRP